MKLQSKRKRYYYSLDPVYIHDTSTYIKNKLPQIHSSIIIQKDKSGFIIGGGIFLTISFLIYILKEEWNIGNSIFFTAFAGLGVWILISSFIEKTLALDEQGISINKNKVIKWENIIRTEIEEIVQSEDNVLFW